MDRGTDRLAAEGADRTFECEKRHYGKRVRDVPGTASNRHAMKRIIYAAERDASRTSGTPSVPQTDWETHSQ
jgi:hypothetical protein